MFHDTVHNEQVSLRGPGDGFPQGTGRKHPAVAETPRSIDDHNLTVARETQVLQAIVGNDDVNAMLDERMRGCNTVASHHCYASGTAAQQQRLIPDVLPTRLSAHQAAPLLGPRSVTSGDDAHFQAVPSQLAREPDHQGRFARATYGQVSYDDYRFANSMGCQPSVRKGIAAQSDHRVVEPR